MPIMPAASQMWVSVIVFKDGYVSFKKPLDFYYGGSICFAMMTAVES